MLSVSNFFKMSRNKGVFLFREGVFVPNRTAGARRGLVGAGWVLAIRPRIAGFRNVLHSFCSLRWRAKGLMF